MAPAGKRGCSRLEVGNPFDPDGTPRHGEGVGLASVRARLAALHGPSAQVGVESGGGRFTVRVAVPAGADDAPGALPGP